MPVRSFTKFVLLVDDDPADRKVFARFLERLGLRVIATGDADTAMQQIVAGNVSCIITDQCMQLSGHELVKIVKSIRPDIELIFLSGADEPSEPLPPEIRFIQTRQESARGCRFEVHGGWRY
jgi:CheY-like chemotaxis protein